MFRMLLTIIPVFCVLGIILIHVLTFIHRKKYAHIPSLPIPTSPKWILGHGPFILAKGKVIGFDLTAIVESFRADLDNAETIVIFSPATKSPLVYSVREQFYSKVLSDHKTFQKPPPALDYVNGVRVLGPKGLALEKGSEIWSHKRRMMDPAFHKKALGAFMDKMNQIVRKLSDYLSNVEDKGCFNVFPVLERVALEMIWLCGFNMTDDFITDPNSPNKRAVKDIFRVGLMKIFQTTFWIPGTFRAEKKLLKEQATYLRGLLTERLKRRVENLGSDNPSDILSHLIQANLSCKSLTVEDVVDDFMVFMIGGMETTGITMSNTIWYLLKHPELAKKVQAEVNQVFGDREELEFEDLNKLVYLEQFIKEVLRLHAPLRISFKITPANAETSVDGVILPPNTRILVSLEAVHHSEKFWQKPEVFDPDRFGSGKEIAPFTYIPFNVGPRVCIGKHFAMMEVKVVISRLLRDLTIFDPYPDEKKLEIITELMSRPKKGIFVGIVD